MATYQRHAVSAIAENIARDLPVFQVIVGPRQVGKTTAAQQIIEQLGVPSVYASADSPLPVGPEWIETQWRRARTLAAEKQRPVLLVLDEVQKVKGWSEAVKALWDARPADLRLLVLGSSALLIQKGRTESLAGRFFVNRFGHWSWPECAEAFGWSLNEWLYFGGYPGAVVFKQDVAQWKQYIADAFVESIIARDVLQLQPVTKPALMRHLFGLAATFPAQVLSYNKMLGQLQDAGNATTLAQYLGMLETAYIVSGLELFSKGQVRRRGSSPKLILWNNALINALSLKGYEETLADSVWWGRLVENAVGAHLLNSLAGKNVAVTYWRKGPAEVDFVLSSGRRLVALEVKSGRAGRLPGLEAFKHSYPEAQACVVGGAGMPLEEFFGADPLGLFF
ncbi:MAG: ATP-binding protein [Sedimentisphaerales bacterium]|nr:ATP-binding protein [Sedimentisphaerales bacterium]